MPDANPAASAADRLDSWKEIASYLKKSVRTVQRLERAEGLPVRRLGKDSSGVVFAYKSELDAWWEERSRRAVQESQGDRPAAAAGSRSGRWYPVALVAAATLAAAAIIQTPWREEPAAYRPVPITSDHGLEGFPSFAPDGERVAYVWAPPGGVGSIYVKRIGAESGVRLTSSAQWEGRPAWSPDGRSIAFLRSQRPKPEFGLILIPAAGGAETRIAEIVAGGSLAWSANGEWLVTIDGPARERTVVAISAKTGAKRVLTKPSEFGYLGPALTPDLRRLIYGRSGPGPSAVYEQQIGPDMTPQGEPRALIPYLMARDLIISHDASSIVYTDGILEEGISLWRMPLSRRAKPECLFNTTNRCFTPALSRDGRRLAFALGGPYRVETWKMSLSDPRAPPVRLLSSTHSDLNPQYSPDGRHIAFHSTRSGGSDIWITDSDGTNARRLTFTNARTTATPRWSPDGAWIAFESNHAGQSEVYVVRSAGGPVRRLTDNPATDAIPSWSRDARTLYFCSNRTGRFEIWKMPASGGQPAQVTAQGGFAAVESPDGSHLYYTQTRDFGPLQRIPLGGGAPETLIPDLHGLFFAVTEQGIYFQTRGSLAFRDAATGRITEILAPPKPMGIGLAASPDGRSLLYTQIEYAGADLYLIDGLR